VGNPAIDGDVVAARGKPGPQLFRTGLEPAVTGWHTTGAKHGYTDHRQTGRAAMKHLQVSPETIVRRPRARMSVSPDVLTLYPTTPMGASDWRGAQSSVTQRPDAQTD